MNNSGVLNCRNVRGNDFNNTTPGTNSTKNQDSNTDRSMDGEYDNIDSDQMLPSRYNSGIQDSDHVEHNQFNNNNTDTTDVSGFAEVNTGIINGSEISGNTFNTRNQSIADQNMQIDTEPESNIVELMNQLLIAIQHSQFSELQGVLQVLQSALNSKHKWDL